MGEAQKNEIREGIARGLREIDESTGISPERDVDRLLLAVGGFEAKEPDVAILVSGRLDAARIGRAMEAASSGGKTLSKRTVQGRTLHVVSKGGKPDSALVLLEPGTLVFGTPGAVEATLTSHAQGKRPFEANTSLLALVKSLDPKAGLWMALGPSATSAMRKRAGPQAPPFPIPDSVTMSGRFGGGFETVAEMSDELAARNGADMVRGGLALFRMKVAQDPEMGKLPALKAFVDALEVSSEGRRVRLAAPAPAGAGATLGIVAAVAIPSLLRARVSANEAATIGDIRTVISAQAAYESVAQGYGDMACLSEPGTCVKGYSGPFFLDSGLAGATDKNGYKRAFHRGPPAKKPRTYQGFAYTATPMEPGKTGVRSFCGDSSGRICFDPAGAAILPVSGAYPASCAELR